MTAKTVGFALVIVLLLPGLLPAQARTSVLFVFDEDKDLPGLATVNRSLRETFRSELKSDVEFYSESLSLSQFRDPGHDVMLRDSFRRKYAGTRLDLIVAVMGPSLDFLLRPGEALFPGVPIVFCGVDASDLEGRTLSKNVTGVLIKRTFGPTLDIALRLQPDTRNVFVVGGTSNFDRQLQAIARRDFKPFEERAAITYLTTLPMASLLKTLSTLPPHSVVFYVSVFADGTGRAFIPHDALSLITGAASAPVYASVDQYVGSGALGGHVYSLDAHGRHAAEIGLRILRGEDPAGIPVIASEAYRDMFDWRQLRRWGLSEASLPPGSDVRYREQGLWDLYRWQIIGAISLFALETVLIVALLAQRANRRRADLRFWQVVETAPYGMIMVGQDGRVAMANAQTEKLFGYRREELLGQPVEMLVPDRFRPGHSAHRAHFSSAPEARPMGAGQELFARRKDGGEFPVEIALSPAQPSAGRLVLATIVDISLRRQAEESLRLSQVELRRLTGRLLHAQEGEARRIARELHDDLGQGLALLTVEMDLLRQNPPEAAGELGARIQELLSLLRQLSSSVHDISHQLHPSKLEQLGLVAAIRGLCHELTHSHGLMIEFKDHQIPAAISPDTAMCLYRIAQEGLRNAVKHSGAQRAEVELSGTAETVSLRIIDDGIGFDPRSIQGKGGLGLVSIRERVLHLGGEIAIDSQPSAGTRIEVCVPVTETSQTPTE